MNFNKFEGNCQAREKKPYPPSETFIMHKDA